MEKLELFNYALDLLNIEPLTEEQLENPAEGQDTTVPDTLNRFYGTALRKASRERDWTFLRVKLDLGEDLGPMAGYRHSYSLPKGLFRLCWADGEYSQVGNKLATNGSDEAYGIMDELPDEGVPEDFYELVGSYLAFLASTRLSSGDQKAATILTIYTQLLQNLMFTDASSSKRSFINREGRDAYFRNL